MPSSNKTGHISPAVRADLAKLHPEQRAEIRRVAGADGNSSSALGANTPAPAVGMDRKVLPTSKVHAPGINREAPPK